MAGSAAAAATVMGRGAFANSGDPTFLTIREAAGLIRTGELSPVDLTRAYLDRIERIDPKINAYITVLAESALERAREMEKELQAGRWRGPLHGIPVALKDNINTAGIRTTAASELFKDRVPDEDAEVVRRLKRSGAVLLGKLNMHEFAFGGTSSVTYFDPVHNPWNLDYIPGGSSGGSAAAVSARLCAGALGTDTAASIRMPASFCSISGLKATHGLTSIRGIIPIAESLDHVGPMCRSVADCALMLQVLAGFDPDDVASIRADIPDFSRALFRPATGFRLGVPEKLFYEKLHPDVDRAMGEALDVLSGLTSGSRDVDLPDTPPFFPLISEAINYHDEYLQDKANHNLYQPRVLEPLLKLTEIPRKEYIQARRELALCRRAIDAVFREVDLLVTPTVPVLAHPIGEPHEGDDIPEITARNTLPFDYYGIPTISIPCGFSRDGLPVGMQISGPRLGEVDVLTLAYAYERATDWHRRGPPLA